MKQNVSLHLVTATAAAALVLAFGSLVEITPASPSPVSARLAPAAATPVVAPAADPAPSPATAGVDRRGRPHRLHRGFPVSV